MYLEACLAYSCHSIYVNCYYVPIEILEILFNEQEKRKQNKRNPIYLVKGLERINKGVWWGYLPERTGYENMIVLLNEESLSYYFLNNNNNSNITNQTILLGRSGY